MKINSYLFLTVWLCLFSSQIKKENIDPKSKKIESPKFQVILDKAELKGSILIYDSNKNTYYSNDFDRAEKQFLPASTFKIPNSLIALELGIVENENTEMLWDGQERNVQNWNQNLSFKEAFHYSCVPCYQNIARQVGPERMDSMLQGFTFGSHLVSSENIDMFWLEGGTSISQMEQIDFLRRFESSQLGISERTDKIAKEMMVTRTGSDFTEIGKTGLSIDGIGWYVGYLIKGTNVYYFATNVQMGDDADRNLRKDVTYRAFQELDIYTIKP